LPSRHNIYLECGKKRTFAGSLDWPGWCRQGRTETEATRALLEYGSRYASIVRGTRLGFDAPKEISQLTIIERLAGNATTDFGAPGIPPTVDHERSCSIDERRRFEKILRAGWRAFDNAVASARGKTLTKGPRGGGRSLAAIVSHVVEADAVYLSAVGWKVEKSGGPSERLAATREAILAALEASANGEIPTRGPRGGERWTARYFARRVTWHVIAHVWEIERRLA